MDSGIYLDRTCAVGLVHVMYQRWSDIPAVIGIRADGIIERHRVGDVLVGRGYTTVIVQVDHPAFEDRRSVEWLLAVKCRLLEGGTWLEVRDR